MPTGGDKIIKLFNIVTPEIRFIGKINTFGYGCKPLGTDFMEDESWSLISFSHTSEPKAVYVLDREAQIYSNILEEETKEPVLINGDTDQVESTKDLERVDIGGGDIRSVINTNRFVKVENLRMDYNGDNLLFGVSVAMTITVHFLPSGDIEEVTLFTLKSDKFIEVKITDSGGLLVYLDDIAEPWLYEQGALEEGATSVVKFYVGKGLEVTSGIATISIHFIDSTTEPLSHNGKYFNCKFFYLILIF